MANIPDPSTVSDKQYISVSGPDGIVFGYVYDEQRRTFFFKDITSLNSAKHGSTHISDDPIPLATCDSKGLMSATDKCRLESITQTRIGILGFTGAGQPGDAGMMSGDIIFAAGSEFISIERVGNVVRFTVDKGTSLACNYETSAQLWWSVDETETTSIRPPTCNGTLPGMSSYGEFKCYLFPESTVVDQADPLSTLQNKGLYPSFIFKRYDDSIQPGTAELDIVLKRNATNQSTADIGISFTPGTSGVKPEWHVFMGLNADGNVIDFELMPDETSTNAVGGLLCNGNLLTKKMAIITGYETDVLATNRYKLKFWDPVNDETIGDEFTAKNLWKYNTITTSPSLVTDNITDLLSIGAVVDVWYFRVGETNNVPLLNYFFIKEPSTDLTNGWAFIGGVSFGDTYTVRAETDPGLDSGVSYETISGDVNFEDKVWGLTGFDSPVMLFGDVFDSGTEGATLNSQHVAIIDESLPGLKVVSDTGTEPFNQRPVVLWNRTSLRDYVLISAKIGGPQLSEFSPYDFLIHAPIDRFDEAYLYVAGASVVDGLNCILVKGAHYRDLPPSGTVRILTPGESRNKIFNYGRKLLFSASDTDGIVLVAPASSDNVYPGSAGDVVELLHRDFSSACVRVEYTVDSSSGVVSTQFKVGHVDMGTAYENNITDDIDDFVRGFEPGYAVSAIYTQNDTWTGVGTKPSVNADGFYVVDGGLASDSSEYWNKIEILLKNDQIWIWWNGLLVPPSASLSSLLTVPVTISSPYFPITTPNDYGKFGVRMWPGARLRSFDTSVGLFGFSEYSYGQLDIVS